MQGTLPRSDPSPKRQNPSDQGMDHKTMLPQVSKVSRIHLLLVSGFVMASLVGMFFAFYTSPEHVTLSSNHLSNSIGGQLGPVKSASLARSNVLKSTLCLKWVIAGVTVLALLAVAIGIIAVMTSYEAPTPDLEVSGGNHEEQVNQVEDDDELPWWSWLLMGIGCVVVLVVVAIVCLRKPVTEPQVHIDEPVVVVEDSNEPEPTLQLVDYTAEPAKVETITAFSTEEAELLDFPVQVRNEEKISFKPKPKVEKKEVVPIVVETKHTPEKETATPKGLTEQEFDQLLMAKVANEKYRKAIKKEIPFSTLDAETASLLIDKLYDVKLRAAAFKREQALKKKELAEKQPQRKADTKPQLVFRLEDGDEAESEPMINTEAVKKTISGLADNLERWFS